MRSDNAEVYLQIPLDKKALDSSVTKLLELETERANLEVDFMNLEKKSDDIFQSFTSHITVLVTYNGGAVMLQNLTWKAVEVVESLVMMVPFVFGVMVAVYVAKARLKRIIADKAPLIQRKTVMTEQARLLHDLENDRLLNQSDDVLPLHTLVVAQSVVRRSQLIIECKNLGDVEKSYNWGILYAIFSGMNHVAIVFYVIYLTFCGSGNALVDWLLSENPVTPHNLIGDI